MEQLSILGIGVPNPLLECPLFVARCAYRLVQVVALAVDLLHLSIYLLLLLLQFPDLVLHLRNLVVQLVEALDTGLEAILRQFRQLLLGVRLQGVQRDSFGEEVGKQGGARRQGRCKEGQG